MKNIINKHKLSDGTLWAVLLHIVNSGSADLCTDHFLILRREPKSGICHQIVDQTGIALGKVVHRRKCYRVDDRRGSIGKLQVMQDVSLNFLIRKTGIVVMDGDALAEELMDRFAERIIEMGFPTPGQGKAVDGIIAVIHEHFDIIEDADS